LSLYYFLSIVYGWKESKLKKIRLWLHATPLVIGFSLAFAGIPLYSNDILACYIPPPTIALTWTNILVFGMVPIGAVIAFTSIMMTIMYLKVRQDLRGSIKWQKGGTKKGKPDLEKEVFWQSLSYLSAFWISWPILLVSNAKSDSGEYPLFVVVMLLAPIQGFSNFLVYVRPRMLRRFRQRKRQKTNTTPDTHTSSSSSGSILRQSVTILRQSVTLINPLLDRMRRWWRRPREEDFVDPEITMAQDVVQFEHESEESAQHGRHRPTEDNIVDPEIIISQDSVRVSARPRLDDFVDPSIRIAQDIVESEDTTADESVVLPPKPVCRHSSLGLLSTHVPKPVYRHSSLG
jgi:hypothetical protein